MELKNAVAVCLISLFSATLVVLIARSLDSQAASRLEPHLARIVEELDAIRASGGITTSPAAASYAEPIRDGLVVYYFYGNVRCPTCEAIESQTHETVRTEFAEQLAGGQIAWKTLNYEQPAASELAATFEVHAPVVVLVRMEEGRIGEWKRLDEGWGLVGDRPAFADFLRGEIRGMLGPSEAEPGLPQPAEEPAVAIPVPEPADLPFPDRSSAIPLSEQP